MCTVQWTIEPVTISVWYKFDTFVIFISTITLELEAIHVSFVLFSSHAFFGIRTKTKWSSSCSSSFYHFSQFHFRVYVIEFDFGHTILFQSNLILIIYYTLYIWKDLFEWYIIHVLGCVVYGRLDDFSFSHFLSFTFQYSFLKNIEKIMNVIIFHQDFGSIPHRYEWMATLE